MQLRRLRDERGETLIELIVALAILGIAAVAILSGLMLSVKTSDGHRKDATGGAYVRSFAEAVQGFVDANGYKACANAASTYQAVTIPDLPSGYIPTVVQVQSWNGTAWGTCTATGIQRLDLRVTSPGVPSRQVTEELTVILREPCNGTGVDPCA